MFNRHPVTPKDERFILQKDDFVMLTEHSEFNWLDGLFQRFIDYDRSNLLKVRPSWLSCFNTETICSHSPPFHQIPFLY
jgi:hypothetical protein